MSECIFCKIARKDMEADVVWEDDHILAFRDINPQAPSHILLIPKHHIAGLAATSSEDWELLGRLLVAAAEVAEQEGIGKGYRAVINNGASAGQSVFHLHVHLLGGRVLMWPPG